jgi:FkbM family methyltransferase
VSFKSFSQIETGQDLHVAAFFAHKRGGYFVDVGAYDGVHLSNTHQLEKELGWSGICVEPLPHAFYGLQASRKCQLVQAAAYSTTGENLEFASSDVLSGIVQHIDRHTEALKEPRVRVKTETLTSILGRHSAPNVIDYLSIDTEGSELEVLRGIDWARYAFRFISLEHNFIEPRRTQMRAFLAERGYALHRENNFDDDFVLDPARTP